MAIEKCGVCFRALRLLAGTSEGRRRGKSFGRAKRARSIAWIRVDLSDDGGQQPHSTHCPILPY
eukprot:scaffold154456_cov61-Attheya_sp.AAC.3